MITPGEWRAGGVRKKREWNMDRVSFDVEDRLCEECALALRRFIGHMEGIESIDVENRRIAVVYDPAKMTAERIDRIARDSLEKLGHMLAETSV